MSVAEGISLIATRAYCTGRWRGTGSYDRGTKSDVEPHKVYSGRSGNEPGDSN